MPRIVSPNYVPRRGRLITTMTPTSEPLVQDEYAYFTLHRLDDELDLNRLGTYFASLNVVYREAIGFARDTSVHELQNRFQAETFANYVVDALSRKLPPSFEEIILRARDEQIGSLKIVRMRKESPLEMVVAGVLPALVIAAIISGGEISYSRERGLRVKLPPLGSGLARLWDAIDKRKKK